MSTSPTKQVSRATASPEVPKTQRWYHAAVELPLLMGRFASVWPPRAEERTTAIVAAERVLYDMVFRVASPVHQAAAALLETLWASRGQPATS